MFLVHNQPIVRQVDDSIVRVVAGRELMLRRSRGYAPLPVTVRESLPPALAVGTQLENAIALTREHEVLLSQHIGDLGSEEGKRIFRAQIDGMKQLFQIEPAEVGCDAHPDDASTQYARASGLRPRVVQHHVAHALAVMAENELEPPVLGVSWDGAGWGPGPTPMWGGEFLLVRPERIDRVAHLRPFGLPGREAAAHEPRRAAIGLLFEILGSKVFDMRTLAPIREFTDLDLDGVRGLLGNGAKAPRTSSVGRLFDAVAALLGVRQVNRFDGQAAMGLEFAIDPAMGDEEWYPFGLTAGDGGALAADWEPAVRAILDDMQEKTPVGQIAIKFHNGLVELIVEVARRTKQRRVALGGGCFQNRYLLEHAIRRLRDEGYQPYWPQRVPPGDGGIALGQALAIGRGQSSQE